MSSLVGPRPLWAFHLCLQADTSPPSKTEVMRVIGFLKRFKAVGPGGMMWSFFKDGGSVNIGFNITRGIDLEKGRDSSGLV